MLIPLWRVTDQSVGPLLIVLQIGAVNRLVDLAMYSCICIYTHTYTHAHSTHAVRLPLMGMHGNGQWIA